MRNIVSTRIWKLFLAAIAIRWTYALLLFVTMGEAGLMEVDSYGFLDGARSFASAISGGSLNGWQWLSPQLHVMPLFGWTLALHMLAFGSFGSLAFVLTQGVLDAGTCILIYAVARSLDERYALPAGIAAALNPTQIVLSGIVFTDTQFAFFIALFLFAATRWRATPSWRWSAMTAAAVGAAVLTRPVAVLWMPVLTLAMLLYAAAKWRLSMRPIAQVAGAAAIMALCLGPVIWRNISLYGSWALTPQGGIHLARWVVPLVKEAKDGTPWMQAYEDMERRTRERFGTARNQFELSRQYTEIGTEQLAALGLSAMIKAWGFGTLINLGSPAIILSPPIMTQPRTGYFATPGTSIFDKIGNFVFHSASTIYTWALLLGIAGVAVIRLLQLAGLLAMLRRRDHWPTLSLLGLWIAFVLATNGPIASPKYRLPIEPALMVMTGAGLCTLSRWRRAARPG